MINSVQEIVVVAFHVFAKHVQHRARVPHVLPETPLVNLVHLTG